VAARHRRLGEGCFWFTFNDIRSSEYVFNRLVKGCSDPGAGSDEAQKRAALVQALREHPYILYGTISNRRQAFPARRWKRACPRKIGTNYGRF